MSESQVRAHWHRGFGRVLDEVMTDGLAGCMGGYFHREFPRYYAGHCPAGRKVSRYSLGGGFTLSGCAKNGAGEGVVDPDHVHECTSLEVIAYQQAFRAWSDKRKAVRAVLAWERLSSGACEVHKVFLQYQAISDLSVLTANRFDEHTNFPGGLVDFFVVGRGPGKPRKLRAVFRGNNVQQVYSPHEALRDYVAAPLTPSHSPVMDFWTCLPHFSTRNVQVKTCVE